MDAGREPEPLTSRSDLILVRRARRERWPVPEAAKERAMQLAQDFMASGEFSKERAAQKFLLDVERLNLADERLEFDRSKLAEPETTGEARDAWDDLLRDDAYSAPSPAADTDSPQAPITPG